MAGSDYQKDTTNAITWSAGAKTGGVIGIDLSTRTGFRTNARMEDIDTEETGWARRIRIAYDDSKGRPYWQEAFTAIIVTHRTCDEARHQYEEQMPGS